MRHSQCDVLLTCCTVILRFEDGRIKAPYPMDAAGAEKVKHFFTAKPDAQEEKELSSSEKPCAPTLFKLLSIPGHTAAIPLPTRIAIGVARHIRTDHFISYGSIFLPKNSGVLPTIRPAIKTVRIAKASIPYKPHPTPPKITSPSCI